MPSVDEIIPVTITENSGPENLASFDYLAIITDDAPNASFGASNRAKKYALSLTGLALVGTDFGPSSDTYNAVQDALNQEQHPEYIFIIKRTAAVAQEQTLTFSGNVLAGQTIVGTVNGVAISVPFDTDMAGTMSDLDTAISAVPGVASASVSGLVLTIVATAQYKLSIGTFTVTGSGTLPTVTKAVSVAGRIISDDIAAAIAEEDTFEWFALCPLTTNHGALLAAAEYMQGARLQLYVQSSESGIKTSGSTTDIAYKIDNLEYSNTTGCYNADTAEFMHVALASLLLGTDTGGVQSGNRTLTGITPNSLTADEASQIEGRHWNHYRKYAGAGRLRKGVRCGDGKPSESVRAKYYWANELQTAAWNYLTESLKPPANVGGRLAMESQLQGVNNRMVEEYVLDTPVNSDPESSNKVTVSAGSDPTEPIIVARGRILHGMIGAQLQIYTEV